MVIQSSLSSSYISGLSDELLVEIFCRLGSPKYAIRCKCICKRWFSLINGTYSCDSYFLRRWRQIHPEEGQPIALLTQFQPFAINWHYGGAENPHVVDYFPEFNKELDTFNSLDFLPCYTGDREYPICVLATFKDLVLCCPSRINHSVYYICNPFTRQWTVLPLPPPLPWIYCAYPNFKNILVGLVVSDDDDCYGNDLKFKVVRVLETSSIVGESNEMDRVYIEIFSSDDSSCTWKRIKTSVPRYSYSHEIVSYRGMLVWSSIYGDDEQLIGFTFHSDDDHGNANYIRLPSPPPYGSGIGVCKGCLRKGELVNINASSDANNIHQKHFKLIIWELNSNGQVWDLVHEFDLLEFEYTKDSFPVLTKDFSYGFNILVFHPQDKDILFLGFNWSYTSEIHLCNVGKRMFEIIREFPLRFLQGNVFPLDLPSWPTPVPLLRCSPELQK